MYYVKVSDPCGDNWYPYSSLIDAEAYSLVVDGELYEDSKDNTKELLIDKAVLSYEQKKRKHIIVSAEASV